MDKLIGKSTLDHKFTTFGDIIYQTCVNNFVAKQHQAKREPKKGRKQCEIQTLQKENKNVNKKMKSRTEKDKKLAAGILARFGGETLSTKKSRIRKEETKSKEKKNRQASTKTHFSLQDNSSSKEKKGSLSVQKEQLKVHLRKTYSDPNREIPQCEHGSLVWPAALGEKLNNKQQTECCCCYCC